MGLIKRNQIHDNGILVLEKAPELPVRLKIEPEPEAKIVPQVEDNIPKAKTEAQKIVERARKEAESITEQARLAGAEAGKAEVAGKFKEAITTVNEAVKERKIIIKDAENEVLRLAIKIAEQILRSEVSLHRDVCLNIVTEAIARISDREQIIVRVNREDSEYLKRYKDRLASMLDGVKSFSIMEDQSIEPGGCVIETNLGYIDAKLATKVKAIEEALQKVASENENWFW